MGDNSFIYTKFNVWNKFFWQCRLDHEDRNVPVLMETRKHPTRSTCPRQTQTFTLELGDLHRTERSFEFALSSVSNCKSAKQNYQGYFIPLCCLLTTTWAPWTPLVQQPPGTCFPRRRQGATGTQQAEKPPLTSESTDLHKHSWQAYDWHSEGWKQKKQKTKRNNNVFVTHYSFYY